MSSRSALIRRVSELVRARLAARLGRMGELDQVEAEEVILQEIESIDQAVASRARPWSIPMPDIRVRFGPGVLDVDFRVYPQADAIDPDAWFNRAIDVLDPPRSTNSQVR